MKREGGASRNEKHHLFNSLALSLPKAAHGGLVKDETIFVISDVYRPAMQQLTVALAGNPPRL